MNSKYRIHYAPSPVSTRSGQFQAVGAGFDARPSCGDGYHAA
jgi:hypothetical protein